MSSSKNSISIHRSHRNSKGFVFMILLRLAAPRCSEAGQLRCNETTPLVSAQLFSKAFNEAEAKQHFE